LDYTNIAVRVGMRRRCVSEHLGYVPPWNNGGLYYGSVAGQNTIVIPIDRRLVLQSSLLASGKPRGCRGSSVALAAAYHNAIISLEKINTTRTTVRNTKSRTRMRRTNETREFGMWDSSRQMKVSLSLGLLRSNAR
jgi:hypothetical protein